MKYAGSLIIALALSGCALPDFDGKPTVAVRATDLAVVETPVWLLNFGDAGLRRMLLEADVNNLDVASARARARVADLTLAQAGASGGVQISGAGGYLASATGALRPDGQSGPRSKRSDFSANMTVRYEPDLTGRLAAALSSATLEREANGLDYIAARRTIAMAVVNGWVALAEARNQSARADTRISMTQKTIPALRARAQNGETTGTELATRLQDLTDARIARAEASGQIALAEARLRALGVKKMPAAIPLRKIKRPRIPAKTDLSRVGGRPDVCAAWLRFHAADAARAETLANTRPRIVVTSSLASTARTLAGLFSGNVAALSNSVSIEGNLLDDGTARRQVDQARIGVATAEISWLQALSGAEIATLEASINLQSAEERLEARLAAYRLLASELERSQARRRGGLDSGLEVAGAEFALMSAQLEIDAARATAFRAAAQWYDVFGTETECRLP
jgi:outer membrane protein TolC